MAIKIYIDQGHNPVNPNAGAEGNGLREQNITYAIGQALAQRLRRSGNYEVRLSRPTESTQLGTSNASSLRVRVEDANSWGADYFISLHTNASDNSSANGVEAYSYARDTRAWRLGEDIVESVSQTVGVRNRGMMVRPSLYVLKRTAMPAVLVELGFITNPREAELMSTSPDLYAEGVYRGIVEYTGLA